MLIKAPGTRKKKQREVPTLRLVCFHSLPQGFLYFFFLNVKQRACHEWLGEGGEGKKKKRKKTDGGGRKIQSSGEKNKTLTRVTHLVARVFVWCSLRRRAAGGGPSLRQRRFPGREQWEGRRVPTTLPNRSHRSPLAGRCVTAETRHSPCGCRQVCEAAGREVPVA